MSLKKKDTGAHENILPEEEVDLDSWEDLSVDHGHRLTSPVNLQSKDAVFNPDLYRRPLEVYYAETRDVLLRNTGSTVRLAFSTPPSDLSGGPLPADSTYRLCEIRFHWGKDDTRGSEHTVNGTAFAMEVQLVHYNVKKYRSYEEATRNPNGIAVIALFVQVGKQHNGLQPMIQSLWNVQYKGQSKTIPAIFNPETLLPHPSLRDFWTYKGSLTWWPFSEDVDWILMRYPLTISGLQLEEFRRLVTYQKGEFPPTGNDGILVDNFRLVQPLHGRLIHSSFQC